ncbi:hypothetical protein MVEN_02045600 [Mycena venus]|uniref:Uncharacterized protein n=1 Tax=Mycena venus TaxID=2733690 RepID=A0A8H6XBF3_9AGAR|nr:hypothetical protein MVEN_02045600 [Mycena venus]
MIPSTLLVLGLLVLVSSSLAETVLQPRQNTLRPLQRPSVIDGLLKRATSSTCATALNCPDGGPCCSDGDCCLISQTEGAATSVGIVLRLTAKRAAAPLVKYVPPLAARGGGTTATGGGTVGTTTKTGTTTNSPTKTTTGGATRTQSTVTSTPTASAGFEVTVVDMSSSALTFTGSWGTTNVSSCSDGASKSVSSDTGPSEGVSTVTYHFTGTAIYVKSASNNAHYMIQLDEDVTEYGGAASSGQTGAPPNCTYGWWRAGLENTAHVLEITAYGSNETNSATSQDAWALELQNFVVIEKTGSGSGSGSGSSGGFGSGSGAGTTTVSVGALAVLLMVGFWIALI